MSASALATPLPPAEITTAEEAHALCAAVRRSAALLADLIDRETELVSSGRAYEIERYQADKAELSAAYLVQMTRLKNNADAVRTLAHDDIAALRPLLQELGARLLRNQDALAAILALSERLIRSAALRAVTADSGPKTYRPDAQVGRGVIANPATSLDRQL